MPSEPFEDNIWADPERVLAPTKEDMISRVLEMFAEERLCACWADEALQVCLDFLPEQSVYACQLFTRTRIEVNQYLSALDELMIRMLAELRTAGRECSKDLFNDPRADVKACLAVELFDEPETLNNKPLEIQQQLPIVQRLDQAVRCYEYTISRIERLLVRFTRPKDELVLEYPTKKLKEILRATRKELFICLNTAEEQWGEAVKRLPELEPISDWKPSADAEDPQLLDDLFGLAPVGNLPIRRTMPPATKRHPRTVPKHDNIPSLE